MSRPPSTSGYGGLSISVRLVCGHAVGAMMCVLVQHANPPEQVPTGTSTEPVRHPPPIDIPPWLLWVRPLHGFRIGGCWLLHAGEERIAELGRDLKNRQRGLRPGAVVQVTVVLHGGHIEGDGLFKF